MNFSVVIILHLQNLILPLPPLHSLGNAQDQQEEESKEGKMKEKKGKKDSIMPIFLSLHVRIRGGSEQTTLHYAAVTSGSHYYPDRQNKSISQSQVRKGREGKEKSEELRNQPHLPSSCISHI